MANFTLTRHHGFPSTYAVMEFVANNEKTFEFLDSKEIFDHNKGICPISV